MKRFLILIAILLCAPFAAWAQTCPGYSYVLTNGQVADANQVMANFNTIMNCANNNLAPLSSLTGLAPLNNPNLTGAPTAPTAGFGDSTIRIATDAFVQSATSAAVVNRGMQSRGQESINGNYTLTAADAGSNLLLDTPGSTLTFPSIVATFWLSNISGGDINLSMGGTDYRSVIHSGEQVGLAGDGGGFYRIVAAGFPYYTGAPNPGDNSTRIPTTSWVDALIPTQASTTNVGVTALATVAQAMAGTATNVAVTPGSLASQQSLAQPGYMTFPGGLLIEWGVSGSVGSNSLAAVVLPHPCQSFAPVVTITPQAGGGSTGQSYAYVTSNTNQFAIFNAANAALAFFWMAICK